MQPDCLRRRRLFLGDVGPGANATPDLVTPFLAAEYTSSSLPPSLLLLFLHVPWSPAPLLASPSFLLGMGEEHQEPGTTDAPRGDLGKF